MSKDPVSYAHPNREAQDLAEGREELPDELKAELRESRTHDLESRLAHLFDDGKTRTINDALIDYWHAHKQVIKRATMTQTLATMAKNGKAVRRAGKGVYVSNKPAPAEPHDVPISPEPYPFNTPYIRDEWPAEPNKVTCDRKPTLRRTKDDA